VPTPIKGKNGGTLQRLNKGETANPNGRPKKLENILHEYFFAEHNVKLSKAQTQDMIQVVLGKTKAELVELAKNDELPFWISLIAKKATRDFEKGSIHILDVLFDRVYGKPREEITQNIIERPIFTGIDLDVQEDDSTGEDSGTP
jgi:hypothetical protein